VNLHAAPQFIALDQPICTVSISVPVVSFVHPACGASTGDPGHVAQGGDGASSYCDLGHSPIRLSSATG
jgi:hypothetical protein